MRLDSVGRMSHIGPDPPPRTGRLGPLLRALRQRRAPSVRGLRCGHGFVLGPWLWATSACGLIVAHDHPSQDPTPSAEDRDVTKRLAEAGQLLALLLLATSVAAEEAPCRTVVVLGDTQHLVVAGSEDPSPGFLRFLEMTRWVAENRKRENSDFVLHVGDVIQSGQQCRFGCDEETARSANAEWDRFLEGWAAIEQAGIPYAIVPGNHDNVDRRDLRILSLCAQGRPRARAARHDPDCRESDLDASGAVGLEDLALLVEPCGPRCARR